MINEPDRKKVERQARHTPSPFWVIVHKELGDHIHSWRFGILVGIVVLACIGSIYSAVIALQQGTGNSDSENYLFLKMFTASDGTLPNFITFVSFLGPLIGIALGFDAVNTERTKGTLSRMLSQPLYRDDFITAKFTAALLLVALVIFSLGFSVMGLGLFTIGYPPTPEEFGRVVIFLLTAVIYVGFWLNLSLYFSVRFRQAATSALSGIALWLFFTVFYSLIVNLLAKSFEPGEQAGTSQILSYQQTLLFINRLSPAELFTEATTTLLVPEVRSLGPLTMEQVIGAIPSPLPLGQSLLLIWPHLTGLIAAASLAFALTYALFMRQEIRSRS
ncbi:ABC transporter permease [Paenibacillus tarimensis]|uniref:ABC transporter permease n=1 Tax=Paenibacillus tarimensis TaxID=416012 RepID=UPI0038B24DBA